MRRITTNFFRNLTLIYCWTAGWPQVASGQQADRVDPLDSRFLPIVATDDASFPPNVWVTGSLAKVSPNANPGTQHRAEISAARNEFESFQIHVRATTKPIQLNVTVSDFVNARGGSIPADANVLVSREAYLNVTMVSDLNGTAGLIPDPLIPARDPYFREKRNAFPVTIPANETRSAWIDVYVPLKTPSGYYVATVTVNDGVQVLAKIPARLKVWGFDLPSTATLKSAFGSSYIAFCKETYGGYDGCGQYPGAKGSPDQGLALTHAAVAQFFLDHRVTVSQVVVSPTSPNGNWSQFDATYGPLLDGKAKTILPGAQLSSIQFPNGFNPNAADLKDWITHFGAKGWLPRLFHYRCDEPPAGCAWDKLLSDAKTFRSMAPNVPILVTANMAEVTKNGVLDTIDILTPVLDHVDPMGGSNHRSSYDAWLKLPGKQLWWYQSCDQNGTCENGKPGPKTSTWPSYVVDASPVRNRIFQWMAFLYNIQGELYFATDSWGEDPWDHIYIFGGNGHGVLFYPGAPSRIGGTTAVPVASLRLNLIRDGMEDFEYLFALARAGQAGLAEQIARSFITNAYTFKTDPEALMAAREKLGTQLHQIALAKQN
ncbi:MAG TPA: glycoside hydrolase domain-containing protein [Bryobacteraceae bacterium]|jgi:hypothetical protein|nr:glycoside hydrolase domain-containing protein [Bryobacteraceae bacterium]